MDLVDNIRRLLSVGFLEGHTLRNEDAQKAVEIAALLPEVARFTKRSGPIVDACCGKGALACVIAHEIEARVHAIERNASLIERARQAAARLAVDVEFVAADVAEAAWPHEPSVVVALHACGGATDATIERAIGVDARALLVVPCCYAGGPKHGDASTVPAQSIADQWRQKLPLPDHGLVGRRFAQSIIDAERTLTLEAAGYETEVVEIWAPSTSPFNFLWRARRVKEPVRMQRARARLDRLRAVRDESGAGSGDDAQRHSS